jgi:hypothetical protein
MSKISKSSYFNSNSKPAKTPASKTSQLSNLDEEAEENKDNDSFLNLIKPLMSTVFKSLPPSSKVLIIVIVSVFGSAFVFKMNGNISIASRLQNEKLTIQTLNFTRAEYQRLKLGMLLVEAEAILGRGIEIEQSAKRTTFFWKNPDKSSITVIFEDGKLEHKKQEGL